jgi:hypothetical protein
MMAQHSVRAASKHGRQPTPILAQESMPHRVYAAVDLAEPAGLQSPVDRVIADAKL